MAHYGPSIYKTPDFIDEPLYVIVTVSNPIRFKTRWKHAQRLFAHVRNNGGILIVVEAAWRERHHALEMKDEQAEDQQTDDQGYAYASTPLTRTPTHDTEEWDTGSTHGHPHQYIKVWMDSELWVKENLINIGMQHLPPDWKYVAWVDADIQFARPNWIGETIHQLQHYQVVQMWSEAIDVGPLYASLQHHRSFMWCYLQGMDKKKPSATEWDNGTAGYYGALPPGAGKTSPGPYFWHPGFAWAYRRDAIDGLCSRVSSGAMLDFAILGAGDNHMAHALVGLADDSVHPEISQSYRDLLREWQWQAEQHIRTNVGVVSGLIVHYWHGRKVDRKYWDRWKILVQHQYDPHIDIKYDWRGVVKLQDRFTPRSIELRDALMRYFRSRNEDSIDLEGLADLG